MIHIGIDFDNTIVSYDALFHKVAVERGAVPAHVAPSKLAVRNYLRSVDREVLWTEMQGYVYGARMKEADPYPGVLDFLAWTKRSGISVSVISHKTRHPFLGPRYDLHEAARCWIDEVLSPGQLVDMRRVYFELTKEEKLARIAAAGCDWFIDDLPEILSAIPSLRDVEKILFDPEGHHAATATLRRASSWDEILSFFKSRLRTLAVR